MTTKRQAPIKSKTFDVVISGAGVPGLALAVLLGRAGLTVAVIDPAPIPAPDDVTDNARTAALMHASVNVLRATGVWDDVARFGAALETLRIVEDSTGKKDRAVTVDFHASDIDLPWFGINMPNDRLRAALGIVCNTIPAIQFFIPTRVTDYGADDTGVSIALDDKTQLRARLLIGADGRNSNIRTIAGIECDEFDPGQSAITCLVQHTRPHGHVSTEHHRPGGPFTTVPLPGAHHSSIVWVEYANDADAFMRMRKNEFQQALQDRAGSALGTVTLDSDPTCWPLKIMRAQKLTAPRMALMAEAAHVLHPMGAQGLNLSLRDCAVLAEVIVDAARVGVDIGSRSVLDTYESRRRPDIMTRVAATTGLNKMVSNDFSILRYLRRAGLKTVDSITPLKKFAMNEGVMPGYDDSRLARGENL